MAEKEVAEHRVTTENMYDILEQPVGLEEVYVRRDGRKTPQGRVRCVCYVKWPVIRRILMEVDPCFNLKAVQTSMGDSMWFEQAGNGKQRMKTPPVHFYAVRELTLHVWDSGREKYLSITRSGCGEDESSPKAAETDANKRAGYNLGVVHMLFEEQFYLDLGLPGGVFWCIWPDKYEFEGGVPLALVLEEDKGAFQPGDRFRGWIKKSNGPEKEGPGEPGLEKTRDPKADALLSVAGIAKRLGIPNAEIRQYIKAVFGANSSAELSKEKVKQLLAEFEKLQSRAQFGKLLQAFKA